MEAVLPKYSSNLRLKSICLHRNPIGRFHYELFVVDACVPNDSDGDQTFKNLVV